MKKFILFSLLTLSISFSCQKENFDIKSDEEIAEILAQDEVFISAIKKISSLIVKSADINSRTLERINYSQDDKEKEIFLIEIGVKDELNLIRQDMNKLLNKYGERINYETILLTLKVGNSDLVDAEKGNIESKHKKLRVANLICTDGMNASIAQATALYGGELIACLAAGPFWAVCDAAASVYYLSTVNAALKEWNKCMFENYGWDAEP
ncbi:hypothetical protein [Haliscomenobacter sp.]|uniref:hypothetical protein n=1 Tax=Haliscomenobacter sp. TaxID=2717303 RepID=UPI0035946191